MTVTAVAEIYREAPSCGAAPWLGRAGAWRMPFLMEASVTENCGSGGVAASL